MGRPVERLVELRDTLRAVSAGLFTVSDQIMIIAAALDPRAGTGKKAQDEPAPPPAGDDLGGGVDDPFDEPVTGEEGDMGDLGVGGDMGGGMGGEMGGPPGGPGGGLGGPGGGFGGPGEEVVPSAENTETQKKIDGLTTQLDGLKRQLVDMSRVLRDIRNPLAIDTKGSDAFQSV